MYGADYCIREFVFLNLHATCPSKTCYRSSLALINNCKAGKRKSPSVRAESCRASLQASGALETKELLVFSCSMENQVSTFPQAVLSHRGASSSSTPAALSAVPALTPPALMFAFGGERRDVPNAFFCGFHSFQPASARPLFQLVTAWKLAWLGGDGVRAMVQRVRKRCWCLGSACRFLQPSVSAQIRASLAENNKKGAVRIRAEIFV